MADNPFGTPGVPGAPAVAPFGSPQPGAPQVQPQSFAPQTQGNGQANGAALPQAGTYNPQAEQPQQLLDPNDPRLFEEQALDPNGDAYAQQPLPPDDRKWKAKLKLTGVEDKEKYLGDANNNYRLTQTKKDKLPYFSTGIALTLLDPSGKYDGVTVYPEFGGEVGTLTTGKMTASKVSTIVQKLGLGPDGRPWYPQGRMNQLAWIQYFVNKVLPSEPTIGIEIQWEGSCPTCGTAASEAIKAGHAAQYPRRVTGMQNFPLEPDAEKRKQGQLRSPNLQCPQHGQFRGRAVVVNFLKLEEVK